MRRIMDKPPLPAGSLRQAWLIVLLALLYGGALAAVQTTLGPVIARNKRDITYKQIPRLVAGAEKSMTAERTVVGLDGREHRVYQAIAADGAHKGWVLPAGGQGFADRIDLLIGNVSLVSCDYRSECGLHGGQRAAVE